MTSSNQVSPFLSSDYKKYLNELVVHSPRGFITQLASAAPCQRSYLSKVLSGSIHITTDQAFNISKFLNHTELESQYFFTLVERERASTKTYGDHLKNRLKKLKQDHDDLSKRLNRTVVDQSDKEAFYYSSFIPCLLHILTSIPEYQTLERISRATHLPETLVEQILSELEKHHFIRKENNHYIFVGHSLHVSRSSPYVLFHHQNWRNQAMQFAQRKNSDNIHYTNIQSMSLKAFEKIRMDLLASIQRTAEISGPSKEEIMVCLLADLFVIV